MKSGRKIVIGSRGSELALWQAHHVKGQLESLGHEVTITIIKTKGDIIQNLSFDKIEGKGFFTKELEEALLSERVDLAVHSLKDLETEQPEGLCLTAVSKRNSPHDVLLIKESSFDPKSQWCLPSNSNIGTSSARRQQWLKQSLTGVQLNDLRGNVPTRIQKLRDGDMDAIVLAEAGLNRIQPDISGLHKVVLPIDEFIPAPAQGVLGLQIRENDLELARILEAINDSEVKETSSAERSVLNGVGGGCHVPLGAFCEKEEGEFRLLAAHYSEEAGYQKIELKGKDPQELVRKMLERLSQKDSSYQDS